MAEIKNTFVKSKMNKDLDARLLPNGEYRDAQNLNINRSEGDDVGAIENILGNLLSKRYWVSRGFEAQDNLEVIGWVNDLPNNRILLFITDYTDTSTDSLSNNAPGPIWNSVPAILSYGATCWIVNYNVITEESEILVSGSFLNFSTTHPIQSNVLEDLLFWTDNRNQPRKININTALSKPSGTTVTGPLWTDATGYYYHEDHISVTKYAPYLSPNFYVPDPYDATKYISGLENKTDKYLPWNSISKVKNIATLTTAFPIDQQNTLLNLSSLTSYEGGLTAAITSNTADGVTGTYIGTIGATIPPNIATTSGAGTGGQISVTVSGGVVTSVTAFVGGTGYAAADTIVISRTVIGGTADVTITLTADYIAKVIGKNLAKPALGEFRVVNQYLNAGTYYIETEYPVGSGNNTTVSMTELNSAAFASGYKQVAIEAQGAAYDGGGTGRVYNHATTTGGAGTGLTVNAAYVGGVITRIEMSAPGTGYVVEDQVTVAAIGVGGAGGTGRITGAFYSGRFVSGGGHPYTSSDGDIIVFKQENPQYLSNWSGDKKFLEDKFSRFSYRFKFDDNEYSLMAPFTQPAFVPKQYGSIISGINNNNVQTFAEGIGKGYNSVILGDEVKMGESGEVGFMKNQINQVKLNITLPYHQDKMKEYLKVKSIDIIMKESDGIALKVVEEVNIDELTESSYDWVYTYNSTKPIKVLPEKLSTRVYDKSPIKAQSQSITGNRVVYGNYLNKHTSPNRLNYELKLTDKDNLSTSPLNQLKKEYPNHTVKQNRNYQVGIVLSDRYGRSSSVLLRNKLDDITSGFIEDTIFSDYTGGGTNALTWEGNSLKVNFLSQIPDIISSVENYPGLYKLSGVDTKSSKYNPLGWYSYKIVVKQTQQEYYNVYLPGATSGRISWDADYTTTISQEPRYINTSNFTNISLYNDNINKVPRELVSVGASDSIYGSTTLLYPRVITADILPIINGYTTSQGSGPISKQVEPGVFESTVSEIRPFKELGEWTTKKGNITTGSRWYPNNEAGGGAAPGIVFVDPIYNADNNPYVATLTTDFIVGSGNELQEKQSTPWFSNELTVFETNPFESNIDIFWETSTSGLISDLNTAITSGLGGTEAAGVTPLDFSYFENTAINQEVTARFEAITAAGNYCADTGATVSNFRVYSTNNIDVTSNNWFSLTVADTAGSGGAPRWVIKNLTTNIWYSYNEIFRRWRFTFDVTANGGTVSVEFKGSLSNIAPIMSYNPVQYYDEFSMGKNGNTLANAIFVIMMKNSSMWSSTNVLWNNDIANQLLVEFAATDFANGSITSPYSELKVELDSIFDGNGNLVGTTDLGNGSAYWPIDYRPVLYSPGTFNGSTTQSSGGAVSNDTWVIAFRNNLDISNIILFNLWNIPALEGEVTTPKWYQLILKVTDCNGNNPNNVGGITTTGTTSVIFPMWIQFY